MKLFKLLINSPDRIYYEGEVYQVTVRQTDGIRQILADHIPAVGQIVQGRCSFTDARKIERFFMTDDGILNITHDLVTVSSSLVQSERAYQQDIKEKENEAVNEQNRRRRSREEYALSKLEMAKALTGKGNGDKKD